MRLVCYTRSWDSQLTFLVYNKRRWPCANLTFTRGSQKPCDYATKLGDIVYNSCISYPLWSVSFYCYYSILLYVKFTTRMPHPSNHKYYFSSMTFQVTSLVISNIKKLRHTIDIYSVHSDTCIYNLSWW